MTENERFKAFLNGEMKPFEDEQFTKVIVDSHLRTLRRKYAIPPANGTLMAAIVAITLLLSVTYLLLYFGNVNMMVFKMTVTSKHLCLMLLVGFCSTFYLYFFHRITLSKWK